MCFSVEGKRRWKPSFKIQDKLESPQNRSTRKQSLDTTSITGQNSTTVKPEIANTSNSNKNEYNSEEAAGQDSAELQKSVQVNNTFLTQFSSVLDVV